jgi:hypothetical protein
MRSSNPVTIRMIIKGRFARNNLSYVIFATLRTPCRIPDAGIIIPVNPSPNLYAITVACRGKLLYFWESVSEIILSIFVKQKFSLTAIFATIK